MMVRSGDPALEDRKVVFYRVGVHETAVADILINRVIDRAVAREAFRDLGIYARLIGHQVGAARDLGLEDRAQRLCGYDRHMEAAHLAVALDQRDSGFLAD